jgi:hypothetical protein
MDIENKVYVGDTPLIKVDCISDISIATGPKIHYLKPDGVSGYWNASITNDPNTGKGRYLQYQTLATDLNLAGVWKFQANLTISGWVGHGETATKTIFALWT